MRRYTSTLAVAGLLAMVVAGVAIAAAPANKSYSGIGRSYWLQHGSWVKHGSGSFHFKTDKPYFCGKNNGVPRGSDCQYITKFSGTYTASCTSGSVPVTFKDVPINQKTNTFSGTFSAGGHHGRLWGSFSKGGGSVKVNYRITLHAGCTSWVRGTAQ